MHPRNYIAVAALARRCVMALILALAFTSNASAQQPGEYVLTASVDGDGYAKLAGTISIVSNDKANGASIHFTREIAEFRGGGALHIAGGTFTIDAVGTAYNRSSPAGACKIRFTGKMMGDKMTGRWESLDGCARLSGKGNFSAQRKPQ